MVVTSKEAMEYLRISKPTFLKLINTGKIKAVKVGKGWRIMQSELDRFIGGEDVADREVFSRVLLELRDMDNLHRNLNPSWRALKALVRYVEIGD